MNQLYEKKCDCRQYDDPNDHRSTLIKMEDSEYEDSQFGGTSHMILRAIRFISSIVILVLLGYALWRIRIIESTIIVSDRITNYTRLFENNNLYHHRIARSIKTGNQLEQNSFGLEKKELAKGTLLTSKNENAQLSRKKVVFKETFEELVNSLFDRIWLMHNDTDRSHFDNNMKAVFQAWFPVFDALLPHEFTEKESVMNTRSAESSEDFGDKRKKREVDKRDKEVLKKHQNFIEIFQKSNEQSTKEQKFRNNRSIKSSSEESSESTEEWSQRLRYNRNKNKGFSKEPGRSYWTKQKSSEESSESSESSESLVQTKNKANIGLMYQVVTPNQNDFMNEVAFNNK